MNIVECPECGKSLKTANPIAPGKKVRCPGCKNVFTMPAAKAPSSTAVRAKSAVPPARPSLDDDDDLPRPKRKRRDEEEDIDDRDEDDEDEDDRPRKKKKKKKKAAGPNWALIGGGAGAGVLVLILVLGFAWPGFFLGGGSSGPALAAGTGQENLLAFLPRDAQIFVGVDATKNADLSKALQEGLFGKIQAQMNQMPGAVGGMTPAMTSGLDELLRDAQKAVAGVSPRGGQPAMAVAISTSKPINLAKIAKAFGADKNPPKLHEGKPLYLLPDGPPGGPPLMLGAPNNRIVLIGAMMEEEFKGLLAGAGQTVQLSADAQTLIGTVDKTPFWAAAVIGGEISQNLQMLNAKGLPIELAPAVGAIKNLKGATIAADETGTKDLKLMVSLTCANDAEAVVVCNAVQALWQKKGRPMLAMVGLMAAQPGNEGLGDAVNDVTKTLKIENKGAVAQASVSVREQTLKKLEQMQGQLQNFGGGNPGGPPPGFVPPKGPPPGFVPPQGPNKRQLRK